MSTSASSSAPAPGSLQAEAFPNGTTDYKPLRSGKYDLKKPHISEQPMTVKNWYKHINWLNTTLIMIIPMIGCVAAYWVPIKTYTMIFAVSYYFHTGLGITAGECLSMGLVVYLGVRARLTDIFDSVQQATTASGRTPRTRPRSR